MTVADMGYSAFEYEPVSGWRRVWPVAWIEFQRIFRSNAL